MDSRRLTFIVVAQGDLETRSYDISYRRLKVYMTIGVVLLLAFIVVVASWWYVAAQAARVPGLEREVVRLEQERARVAELARTLSQVEAQYERVRSLLGADAPAEGSEPWLPPLRPSEAETTTAPESDQRPDAWPLTQSGFITRSLTDAGPTHHPGLDIAVPTGSYIRAAGAGQVEEAGDNDVYGRYVLIDHGDGYETMYGHASELFVKPGQRVQRDEVIALSGSTGRSTAPHLHFEIRHDGLAVDPLTLVEQP